MRELLEAHNNNNNINNNFFLRKKEEVCTGCNGQHGESFQRAKALIVS